MDSDRHTFSASEFPVSAWVGIGDAGFTLICALVPMGCGWKFLDQVGCVCMRRGGGGFTNYVGLRAREGMIFNNW